MHYAFEIADLHRGSNATSDSPQWLRALVERASGRRPRVAAAPPRRQGACAWPATTSPTGRSATSASMNSPPSPASGSSRLIRLFRERTGLPPHALQVAHRVRNARRLLEAGEPIADIAAATGFADQSHLHRHFQRSLGLTPGEYRRRLPAPG